jgi:hypothetical protein
MHRRRKGVRSFYVFGLLATPSILAFATCTTSALAHGEDFFGNKVKFSFAKEKFRFSFNKNRFWGGGHHGQPGGGTGGGAGGGSGGGSGGGGLPANPYGNWNTGGYTIYEQNIASAPTHPNSATWLATYGSGSLHPFFGTVYAGSANGYFLNTAPQNRPTTPYTAFNFGYGSESDPVNYYFDYTDDYFEGDASNASNNILPGVPNVVTSSGSDCHWMAIVQGTNTLQEIYGTSNGPHQGVTWWAGCQFSLSDSTSKRTLGWTSADDSGQAMTPISIKYEEMSQGPAHHPLRLTINHTDYNYSDSLSNGWEWPASHAGDVGTSAVPPEGAWWRLNPNFSTAGYSQINVNIINTLITLNDGVFIDVNPYCVTTATYQTNGSGTGPLSLSSQAGDASAASPPAAMFSHHTKSEARALY